MKRKFRIGSKAIFNPHPKNSIVNMPVKYAGYKVRIVGDAEKDENNWDFRCVPGYAANTATASFLCKKNELVRR